MPPTLRPRDAGGTSYNPALCDGAGYAGAVAVPAVLQPGEVIGGRYEIVAPISSGAMGAVFRARGDGARGRAQAADQPRPGRPLRHRGPAAGAPEPPAGGGRDRPRPRRRAATGWPWSWSRAPTCAASWPSAARPGLPPAEVLEAARQAAEALEYVHGQQVVHRDVKPHNLLMAGDGVVLVDFGVAREVTADAGTRGIGTPRFMAPEVLVGEGVSPRSDVYGLAATVWTLLSGSPPAYGDPEPLPGVAPGAGAGAAAGAGPAARAPVRLRRRAGGRAGLAGADRGGAHAGRHPARAPSAPTSWSPWCAPRPACSTPPRPRSR